jgi:HAD superfamily hydrolase (TIGR01490 family)
MTKPRLTLFDLDHTLLAGDTDALWCRFLIAKGILDPEVFGPQNAAIECRYQAGTVTVQEFAEFYLGTLKGRSPDQWEPLRQEFLATQLLPRISAAATLLVNQCMEAGDLVVMTTATSRFLAQPSAQVFGIAHLLATEAELVGGLFSGRTSGTVNMRAGKMKRLVEWLDVRGQCIGEFHSRAYSDSVNDLPLLEAVDEPVAVDPDPLLADTARSRGWQVLNLHGCAGATPWAG